jgi:hypothetical protein
MAAAPLPGAPRAARSAPPATTAWGVAVDAATHSATLTVSVDGAPPSPVRLKGVCYSPAPLNGSNAFAPAIGDWFWDSFGDHTNFFIQGWDALWARDLPRIRALGANTIRVYSTISRQLNTDGTFPAPGTGQLFTHTNFLDACWNQGQDPLYVLAGIPLPAPMYWKAQYQPDSPETQFWNSVIQETAAQLGTHPAILGFIIQNEQDGPAVTYGNPDFAQFWWGQVQAFAAVVKAAAPTKLVGMATHDDPNIPGQAASYMAQCPAMDFWGVNTYQTINFDGVFDPIPNIGPGYDGLTGGALKPVILTEWGMPATSHSNPADPATIYEDATTRAKAANVVSEVAPLADTQPLCLGLYYFEFCDEWWNESLAPNVSTWWGGTPASGFPNGFWDQDGFGLYSIARGPGLNNSDPIWVQNGGFGQPETPIDVHTERTELTTALAAAFAGAPAAGPPAERHAEVIGFLGSTAAKAAVAGADTPGAAALVGSHADLDRYSFHGAGQERITVTLESPPYRINRGTDAALLLRARGGQILEAVHGPLPLTTTLKLPTSGEYSIDIHNEPASGGDPYHGFYRLIVAGSRRLKKVLAPHSTIE